MSDLSHVADRFDDLPERPILGGVERLGPIPPKGGREKHKTEGLDLARAVWAFEVVRGTGDAEITRVAEVQRGVVHRKQLLTARQLDRSPLAVIAVIAMALAR